MPTIKDLQNYLNALKQMHGLTDESVISYDLWLPEDVRHIAESIDPGAELTQEQIDEVLNLVEHRKDATVGTTWDTLYDAVREVLGRK